ncbi:MAG: alginate lyase [Alphaproteobacteria bacterium]|nr:alginate lyase [Alphaproteobacteria bacterium]
MAVLGGAVAPPFAARARQDAVPADDARRRASTAGFSFTGAIDAAALPDRKESPAAAAILRSATRALDRAPHAMTRVHVEGTLPGQGIYDQSNEALRDLEAMRDLAIAARLSGQTAYAAAAVRLARAWADVYRPSFNPIDETRFDNFMLALDLFAPPDRASVGPGQHTLLRGFADGYPRQVVRGATATNNWNSHRVKLAVLSSFAMGELALVQRAKAMFEAQLSANIDRRGEVYDFAQRDALRYVVYSLEPLMMSVLAARRHGEDWYGLEGGRLGLALAWLRPYVEGQKTHEEFRRSKVDFDRVRREAGLTGFGGPFMPAKARLLYGMAARVDRSYAGLAGSLRANRWDDAWLEVLWPRG